MKKMIPGLVALTLGLGFVGCKKSEEGTTTATVETKTDDNGNVKVESETKATTEHGSTTSTAPNSEVKTEEHTDSNGNTTVTETKKEEIKK